MELFNNESSFDYIESKKEEVKKSIANLSNDKIFNNQLDDLEEYFYEKFKIDLIEIEREFDYLEYDVRETVVEKSNSFYGYWGEPRCIKRDGYQIIYNIPFEGDSNLLYIQPSTHTLMRFKVDKIINPTQDKEGRIVFSKVYERSKIKEQEDELQFIKNDFNSNFRYYFEEIDRVNKDITLRYNSSLKELIRRELEVRLEKAQDYFKLREKLNIPLEINKGAPNMKPMRLKKVKKNKTQLLSNIKRLPVEYGITDTDYDNIKSIINLSCISMEKTARTFSKLLEEELRDVILASLNTHYLGTATGETFNKIGKTDIHIPFENKSAYIGECKIWSGKGNFIKSINQLFGYIRWRDTKTSLIFFNKKNKNFFKILENIDDILSNEERCIKKARKSPHEWQCEFKKDVELTEVVFVNIVIYDLYVEEEV